MKKPVLFFHFVSFSVFHNAILPSHLLLPLQVLPGLLTALTARPGFWVTTITKSLVSGYSDQWTIQTWWKKASFDKIVPVSVNSECANKASVSWGNTGVQRVWWFWKWITAWGASSASFLLLGCGWSFLHCWLHGIWRMFYLISDKALFYKVGLLLWIWTKSKGEQTETIDS